MKTHKTPSSTSKKESPTPVKKKTVERKSPVKASTPPKTRKGSLPQVSSQPSKPRPTHNQCPSFTKEYVEKALQYHTRYSQGVSWEQSSLHEKFQAVALSLRERIIDGIFSTENRYQQHDAKRLHYLSLEFLMGRSLSNNLSNLGYTQMYQEALNDLHLNLHDLLESEADAALGNGGLGRLAACFLDSLATLGMPGYGYGINYEFGLFRQEVDSHGQKEKPDHWLWVASPWLIEHREEACMVPLYGYIKEGFDLQGNYTPMWLGWKALIGIPHDFPIVGYGGHTVNILRLFTAKPSDEFDMQTFNDGDYVKAMREKVSSETISKVLYPSDSVDAGKELRLIQEYFLVACSLRDIMRRYLKTHTTFEDFPSKVAIQLNDTHPALTVAELMRLLIDEHQLLWDEAWEITTASLGYTNHTLLSEALEKWSVPLMGTVLPRHLQIIFEINHKFLTLVKTQRPNDPACYARMSIIEEGETQHIRMAHLSIVGSHSVNGVAALHSELVKTQLVPDFYDLWPERFNNKTNGITQRRWLLQANPLLANHISSTIGEDWITNLSHLKQLEPFRDHSAFRKKFLSIKQHNKKQLAKIIWDTTRTRIRPDSFFIIQAKRIHEYKRQLLNVMNIIHQYLRIIEDGETLPVPHTYIFAGKAAPGYWAAKQMIRLIYQVGQVINQDARANDQLQVIFLPDFRVSLAEKIYPAADLSEQISTAGMEASGTGNMKFALNGALTMGTLDGANIEIMEEVGKENIYIFGLTAEEIQDLRSRGTNHAYEAYSNNPHIHRMMDTFQSNLFCPKDPGLFSWIFDSILHHGDHYCHLADFESYISTHERAAQEFQDQHLWANKAILNIARIGKFSSDRTISEYARDIWNIHAVV
jgi:starch phosphorylase